MFKVNGLLINEFKMKLLLKGIKYKTFKINDDGTACFVFFNKEKVIFFEIEINGEMNYSVEDLNNTNKRKENIFSIDEMIEILKGF